MSHTEKHAAVTPSCSSTLPSPCAVFPPLHPDCSQTQPQWRLCWGRVVDCSASPLALQSDIQENCSPPQNNGPKGYRDKSNGDKVILCVYIYINSLLYLPRTKAWCSKRGNKSADVSLGAIMFVLTSSIRQTRRLLRAAIAVRSWKNWFRPSLLSALAAAKSNLSQSHSSTAAALIGHKISMTWLNSKGSYGKSFEYQG